MSQMFEETVKVWDSYISKTKGAKNQELRGIDTPENLHDIGNHHFQ